MSDPKAHQLYKQAPLLFATVATASSALTAGNISPEWTYHQQTTSGLSYQAFSHRSYIDLSGWSAQDLTTFTTGVDIQTDKIPLATLVPDLLCPLIWTYDILSTRKITDDELETVFSNPLGFHSSTLDLMQVIYGEGTSYAVNSNIPGTYITVGGDTFGSGNPCATDKLHWTRIIITTFAGADDKNGAISYGPANLVVQAATMEEKDLVYMERLRRSYVLQGEV